MRQGWVLLVGAVAATANPVGFLGAETTARPGASSAVVITVPLEYRETARQVMFRDVPIECRSVPFPREPKPEGGAVTRGLLKFAGNLSNAVPFIWQGGAKKLFLDLNRNQDLTDDPGGEFPAQVLFSANPAIFLHQAFTNVPLSFPATSAGAPMRVDLVFCLDTLRHPNDPFCNVAVGSFWQGKLTRGEQEWEVTLLPNLSDQPGSFRRGQLLLRPWAERDERFIAASEKSEDTLGLAWEGKNWMARASEAFAFTPEVFFAGQPFHISWTDEPRSREDKLVLRLTERPTAVGELRITGSFVHRLVLTGEPCVVVLAQPAASVKVPCGRYQLFRALLKLGKGRAYFNYGAPQSGMANVQEPISFSQMPVVSPPPSEQAFVVDEHRSAVLAVGGPLTNCVLASHRGRNLGLTYRLTGAGGRDYRMWLSGGEPRFTILKSGKEIASGKFVYG
jgi:hypothetical protein